MSGPALLADRGLRLREGRIGPDLVTFILQFFISYQQEVLGLDVVDVAFAKVRDEVEESLVKEGDNVRLWQMRIKTAIEQVVLHTNSHQQMIPTSPINLWKSYSI